MTFDIHPLSFAFHASIGAAVNSASAADSRMRSECRRSRAISAPVSRGRRRNRCASRPESFEWSGRVPGALPPLVATDTVTVLVSSETVHGDSEIVVSTARQSVFAFDTASSSANACPAPSDAHTANIINRRIIDKTSDSHLRLTQAQMARLRNRGIAEAGFGKRTDTFQDEHLEKWLA
ncbi:DUF1668 domain-containing protein [Rhizobium sp. P38BS-XIX]|nr:DUF1668 domain-containing protein [Rhizobium sp. P38BS-XIX]